MQERKFILDEMIKETKGPTVNGQETSVTHETTKETGTRGDPGFEAQEHPNNPAGEANATNEDSAMAEAEGIGAGVNEAMVPAGDSSNNGNILTPTTSVRSGGTVRASDAPLADSLEATGATQLIGDGTEVQNLLRQMVTQSREAAELLQATNANLAELIRLQEMSFTKGNRHVVCRSSEGRIMCLQPRHDIDERRIEN